MEGFSQSGWLNEFKFHKPLYYNNLNTIIQV